MKVTKRPNSKKWQVHFNHNKKRCRWPVSESKSVTDTASRRIEALQNCGGVLDKELRDWLKYIPDKLRAKLVTIGLVDKQWCESQITKTLAEHLEDFLSYLQTKESKPKYVFQARSSIEKTFEVCNLKVFTDIDGLKVVGYWTDLKKSEAIGQRTYNYNLRMFKMFTRWLVKKRRVVGYDPMDEYDLITQTKTRKNRRAFTVDEERRLLEVTPTLLKKRDKLTGFERCLVYRLALCTGARAGEIKKLKVQDFDFDDTPPTVTVEASNTKNKRTDYLRLTKGVAEDMRVYLAGREPQGRAFNLVHDLAGMIRKDEADAGIEYRDISGDLDFHALRVTYGTRLAEAGVFPAKAQKLMRHSTVELTMKYYTKPSRAGLDRDYKQYEASQNVPKMCPNPAQIKTNMDMESRVDYNSGVKMAIAG